MDHKPAAGQQPLDPPDRATAQAYLDELPGVRQRREIVLDRSRMARLYFVEGIAFGVFIAVLLWMDLLRRLTGTSSSSSTFGLLVVLLLWNGLSLGIRERYGARQGIRGTARIVNLVLLLTAVFWAVVLIFVGAAVPAWVRAGPVLLALVGGFWPGIVLNRDARGAPKPAAPPHAVMTRPGRGATFAAGVALSVTGLVTGLVAAGDILVSNLGLVCAVIVIIAIAICTRMGFITELGAMWRPPQWIAFALSALAIAVVMVRATASPPSALLFGIAAAGAILALFVVASVWPAGPDA
ncbi:hypothetical protein [Microbacterium sp. 22242]|uniref:hypothetical protein n=1 Tax=Microbacterium sp. 22242 TaxID=3453896 RepID=UPI003F85D989